MLMLDTLSFGLAIKTLDQELPFGIELRDNEEAVAAFSIITFGFSVAYTVIAFLFGPEKVKLGVPARSGGASAST